MQEHKFKEKPYSLTPEELQRLCGFVELLIKADQELKAEVKK